MEAEVEWEHPPASEELRQGDILRWENPTEHAESTHFVVITADCDIKNKKHGAFLACLPVIHHERYIKGSWARARTDEFRRSAIADAKRQLDKPVDEADVGRDLSEELVQSWLQRESIDLVLDGINSQGGDRKKRSKMLIPIREALLTLLGPRESDFDACISFRAASLQRSVEEAKEEMVKKAQGHCASLPDDLFFLPGLPGDKDRAALVLMRELVGLPSNTISTQIPSAKAKVASMESGEIDEEAVYSRIARLKPTYKYSLSQRFGALYSRIGLPSSFEARRAEAISRIKDYQQ